MRLLDRVTAGEANCIMGLGDIALESSRIPEPYSIGRTNQRLARVAANDKDRVRHVQSAREPWRKIDRPDLIKELDDEFGAASAAQA